MRCKTPKMSRSHFVLIAETIARLERHLTPEQVEVVAKAFADSLYATNSGFKVGTFIEAATKSYATND